MVSRKFEILIIILILIVLIVGNVFVISYLNEKSRDIKVLSEVSQMRGAFENYLNINNFYPELSEATELNDPYNSTQKLCSTGFKRLGDECDSHILRVIPNTYLNEGNIYKYQSINDNKNYLIEFSLNTNFNQLGLFQGKSCANNFEITNQPCF